MRGYLPGALWKDCERIRGRPDEVMSALKTSPFGHGGEPRTPTPGLATLKSETRHTYTCMSGCPCTYICKHTCKCNTCTVIKQKHATDRCESVVI